MAKDGDFIASWAFYIHEIGIGALHQALLLVFPLLLFWRGLKKILCERHVLVRRSSPPESTSVNFLVLTSVTWLCQVSILEGTEWKICGNSAVPWQLYYKHKIITKQNVFKISFSLLFVYFY